MILDIIIKRQQINVCLVKINTPYAKNVMNLGALSVKMVTTLILMNKNALNVSNYTKIVNTVTKLDV